MKKKNNIPFKEVQSVMGNTLDELVRNAAQKMISKAIKMELSDFLDRHKEEVLDDGKQAVVKNGYHKKRYVTINSGTVGVKIPRTRNRLGGANFTSSLVPRYLKRSITIDSAIPLLYLKGISTNDMEPALRALLGNGVEGLSATNISRLKSVWINEFSEWNKQDLSEKNYCYVWVDGIYFNLRMEEDRLCVLVMLGVREDGSKELIAVDAGHRESTESWSCFLRTLKARGLRSPKLFIGDGALGFWNAANNVFPKVKWQRCWVHKTADILDKLPKKIQPKAKNMIHEIYRAPAKEEAIEAYDLFVKTFEAKYPRAVDCLIKNQDELFSFYDFPAEHWTHIRTTNAIESTFATVRLRTNKTRGHGNAQTTLAMVFKLMQEASKRYMKLKGYKLISKVMEGVKFRDGEMIKNVA